MENNPQRFVVAVFGYCGAAYFGSCRGGDETRCPTAEGALVAAVGRAARHKCDVLTRASRTDKGVHALGNVCMLRIGGRWEETELERLRAVNRELENEQVRVLRLIESQKHWDARRCCARRDYEYSVPYRCLGLLERVPDNYGLLWVAGGAAVEGNEATCLALDAAPGEVALPEEIAAPRRALHKRLRAILRSFSGTMDYAPVLGLEGTHRRTVRRCSTRLCSGIGDFLNPSVEPCAVLAISGQSFLYKQILTIVGLVVLLARDNSSELGDQLTAFRAWPLAPARHLLLRRCRFHPGNPYAAEISHVDKYEKDLGCLADLHDMIDPHLCDADAAKAAWPQYYYS